MAPVRGPQRPSREMWGVGVLVGLVETEDGVEDGVEEEAGGGGVVVGEVEDEGGGMMGTVGDVVAVSVPVPVGVPVVGGVILALSLLVIGAISVPVSLKNNQSINRHPSRLTKINIRRCSTPRPPTTTNRLTPRNSSNHTSRRPRNLQTCTTPLHNQHRITLETRRYHDG